MVKRQYPDVWNDKKRPIQTACFERANWRCEVCGTRFIKGKTKAVFAIRKDGKPLILTVHHIDNNGFNNDPSNLLACCQRCHLTIEGKWVPGGVLPVTFIPIPRWIIERKLPYILPEGIEIPVKQYPMFVMEDYVKYHE